jgi:hypothetical protein
MHLFSYKDGPNRDVGTKTMPEDLLAEVLKNGGYKGGHQPGSDLITRPSRKHQKQPTSFPFTFPYIPFPSLNSFSPFKSRPSDSQPSDGETDNGKRPATEASTFDGPKLSDWLPPFDEKYSDFPVLFQDLLPKTRGEGIVYLADLLEYDATALSSTLGIQVGTSKFLLRKAREEMEKLKRVKRVRIE